MQQERLIGMACIITAAALWSLGGVGIKSAQTDALAIAGFRSFFALFVLGAVILGQLRHDVAQLRGTLQRRYVWWGGLSYALTMLSFTWANKLTTAANAILLQYTAPVFVALLARPLLDEPITRRDRWAIGGCFFGMAWFFLGKLSLSGLLGNLLAIAAGVGFAGIAVCLRADARTQSPTGGAPPSSLVLIALGNALAALLCAPAMVAAWPALPGPTLGLLAGLGILQIGVAYVFFAMGVSRVSALESTLLAMLEPVLNPIWVAMATGERPAPTAFIGGGIVIGVIIWRQFGKQATA
ncbi:MAG: DMT family transporter [Chloracidobacterium sp.]|uniref:DMT family transporter n=1 Tax=Chloracidobacterium validum TaxID=2821543 RepID=A0ABX8BHE9_9BACT|nr:DMT family transporter [Chloracidobacterium validum]QUW04515.1 DMT family transporter [Chloracidobacterium validum]